MGKINIKFGYPTSGELEDLFNLNAIEDNCSLEQSLFNSFNKLTSFLAKADKGERNFFDLAFITCLKVGEIIAPKITNTTYVFNGHKLPMLIVEKEYAKQVQSGNKILISDAAIDEFGMFFQDEFDYEYAGFERINN